MNRCLTLLTGLALSVSAAHADIFPTLPHAATNFIPFGAWTAGQQATMHQVFASSLFSNATGGLPAEITAIAFAPGVNGPVNFGQVDIRFGYTNALPGVAGSLDIPVVGGGGAPNAIGAMSSFFSNAATTFNITAATTNGTNFSEMVFTGTPFIYDPTQGNLLLEIVIGDSGNTTFTISRCAGSAEGSRTWNGMRFAASNANTQAARIDFTFTPVMGGCDPDITTTAIPGSAGYLVPNGVLNNDDFFAFLIEFSAGNLAVADVTTTAVAGSPGYGVPNGVINNDDFFYYLIIFSAGC